MTLPLICTVLASEAMSVCSSIWGAHEKTGHKRRKAFNYCNWERQRGVFLQSLCKEQNRHRDFRLLTFPNVPKKKKKRMFFFLFSFGDSRGWHHFVIKVSARLSPFYRTSYQIPLFYFLRQFTWLSSGLFVSLLSVYSSSSFIHSLLPSHLSFLFISSFSSFLLLSFACFQCFAINEIQLYEFKDFLCLIHW